MARLPIKRAKYSQSTVLVIIAICLETDFMFNVEIFKIMIAEIHKMAQNEKKDLMTLFRFLNKTIMN